MAVLENVSAVRIELEDFAKIVKRTEDALVWYRTKYGNGSDPPEVNINAELSTLVPLKSSILSALVSIEKKVSEGIYNVLGGA